MNLLFDLPIILQGNIYEFDNTFREKYDLCMLELNLHYKQYLEVNKLLRNFYRQRILFQHYAQEFNT